MNKNELAAALSDSASMSKVDAARFVGHVLGHIVDAVKRGEEVRLDGFGIFTKQHRPAGEARNPRTGETVQVGAKDVPKFRPAKAFTDALNVKSNRMWRDCLMLNENRDHRRYGTNLYLVAGALPAIPALKPLPGVRGERNLFEIGDQCSAETQICGVASAEPTSCRLKPNVAMSARAPIYEIGDQNVDETHNGISSRRAHLPKIGCHNQRETQKGRASDVDRRVGTFPTEFMQPTAALAPADGTLKPELNGES